MSVNKVILVGYLGKDPESRFMPNGDAVANVSLATSKSWKDKNGAKQERTEWHHLIFFRQLAEIAGKYLRKGSLIYVEGEIQTRKWQDKETGQDRYMTEILVNEMKMLGGKQKDGEPGGQTAEPRQQSAAPSATKGTAFDNMDDDIPF